MSKKKNNKSIKRTVMVGASCIVLAAVWAVLAVPGTALAAKPEKPPGKPGGGGDDGVGDQPCVIFDDVPLVFDADGNIIGGDNIQSDLVDTNDDGVGDTPAPYCDNKKAKVRVTFSNDGHLKLKTNDKFFKGDLGRSLFIDFGCPIRLFDGPSGGDTVTVLTGPSFTFTSTDELDAAKTDPTAIQGVKVINHSVTIVVGAGQSDFDFFDMLPGEEGTRTDVNFHANLRVDWEDIDSGESISSLAIIWLQPVDDGDRHCQVCDPVTVHFLDRNPDPDSPNFGLLEWRVTTGLGEIVDCGTGALAEVTQNTFSSTEIAERFPRPFQFGFTVTAP